MHRSVSTEVCSYEELLYTGVKLQVSVPARNLCTLGRTYRARFLRKTFVYLSGNAYARFTREIHSSLDGLSVAMQEPLESRE